MLRIINFYRLGVHQLPVHLRRPRIMALVRALTAPLYKVQSLFLDYRNEVVYKIEHNGQVCYLQGALNDTFDNTARRIRIVDLVRNEFLILSQRPEMKEVSLGQKLISRRDSVMAEQLDFVVKAPRSLNTPGERARLVSIVNFYKLAGKRYTIDYE